MSQPTINIGLLGCVSDGKSSLVRMLTGIRTQKHSKEMERNITIRLGYANCKIFKCPNCPIPTCYYSTNKHSEMNCEHCGHPCVMTKHISFVDSPGHHSYISTLLSGINIIDHSIVVVSGAEDIETKKKLDDHLRVLDQCNIPEPIFCLNKLDLIMNNRQLGIDRRDDLKHHIEKQIGLHNPLIIPTSFNLDANKDMLLYFLDTMFDTPQRDVESKPHFIVTRSFDVNKPYSNIDEIIGGVVGGSIVQGKFKIGDSIEILPGHIYEKDGFITNMPIQTQILSIKSEQTPLREAGPGGLIALGLNVDPALTKSDRIVGQRIGLTGQSPKCVSSFVCEYSPDIKLEKKKEYLAVINACKLRVVAASLKEFDGKKYVKFRIVNNMVSVDPGEKLTLTSTDKHILGVLSICE